KADGSSPSPAVQPQARADAPPKNEAADAPRNEPLVKRWQAGEVPDAVSGNATVFEKVGAAPPAAAPAKGGPAPGTYPTAADAERISSNPDAAARNLDITQGYSDISNAMGQILGKDNATWATFATWASKQAGVSIRGEDVPKIFTDAIKGTAGFQDKVDKVNSVLKRLGLPQIQAGELAGKLAQHARGAMDQLQDSIGNGNVKVFKEIAPEFAKFIDTFKGATKYDQAKVDAYLAHFPPDQQGLKNGFANYAKAQFETDPKKKAELMLLANDQIVQHEQGRLQPDIQRGLDAPIDQVFKPALKKIIRDVAKNAGPFGTGGWLYDKLDGAGLIDKAISPVLDAVGGQFRKLATSQLMTLETPSGTLKLGQDVPRGFPADLKTIDNPDLKALLAKVDRTPDTTRGSAAGDWSNVGDRMNFVTDLFRAYSQDPNLFKPPFPGRTGSYSKGN
ncbi:MAG TPA: hypothetical protein VND93_33815, partial [Myxococcales bacterium]|nr:hypothetical protein [Myxococcales bacterium]